MSTSADPPKSFGIVLYPEFEVLDATGPLETLNCFAYRSGDKDIKLSVISRSMDPIAVGKGLVLGSQKYLPTHTFETAPQLDVLLIPGGAGCVDFYPGMEDHNVDDYIDYVRRAYRGYNGYKPLKYIMSVCNGTILLIKAGILDGRKATSNKEFYSVIANLGPKTHWIGRARWVVDGNVWTTSGVSAGVDGFLALLATTYSEDAANTAAKTMEWTRTDSPDDDPFAEACGTEDILPKSS